MTRYRILYWAAFITFISVGTYITLKGLGLGMLGPIFLIIQELT